MLTAKTLRALHRSGQAAARSNPNARRSSRAYPWWDGYRTLYYQARVVKRFKRTAPNMQAILDEFQRRGWPRCIDDTLPHVRGRNRKRRLHETIQNLNRCLDRPLIRFRGDGFGKGVCWEPASKHQ